MQPGQHERVQEMVNDDDARVLPELLGMGRRSLTLDKIDLLGKVLESGAILKKAFLQLCRFHYVAVGVIDLDRRQALVHRKESGKALIKHINYEANK